MIKILIEKELREIIISTKFAITFGVCAVLILLAFISGASSYKTSRVQHEAALAENLRQMEGITSWQSVRGYRIFLPPQPLASLVTGVSNDIGRSVEMSGRSGLSAQNSRFNDEPVYAVFRFLDLDFIFQIVLSLFAILFAYNAINGEKEQGTLRLSFVNALPRSHYIIGKVVGSFIAIGIPVLIPILLGCLMLPLLGVSLTGDEWLRLFLIITAGLLYFGAFLMLSIFVSALTSRSSSSFLILLVLWIFFVLIIPRSSILLAGRAVEVPSVDDISSRKARLSRQLFSEDAEAMSNFKPGKGGKMEKILEDFQKMMKENAEKRERKMRELNGKLQEERMNRLAHQERVATSFARISPTSSFSLAAINLAGTSTELKQHFLEEATAYQKSYVNFVQEKTGMNLSGGIIISIKSTDSEEEEKPIDIHELPQFRYSGLPLDRIIRNAILDLGVLGFFNVLFFAGAFVAFQRYDLR